VAWGAREFSRSEPFVLPRTCEDALRQRVVNFCTGHAVAPAPLASPRSSNHSAEDSEAKVSGDAGSSTGGRIYEADESFRSLDFMVHTKLYRSHIVVQILIGAVTPIALLALTQVLRLGETARKRIYAMAGCLTLIGIFAMRWNVVIGGQLFSGASWDTRHTR
jgi:hypothetical protein